VAEHALTVKTVTVSYDASYRKRPRVDGPVIAREIVLSEMRKRDTDVEHILLIMQTSRHCVCGFKCLHTGTATQSPVDARKLFQIILKCGAAGFILAHNHPSGDLAPSSADIALTRKLALGAAVLDLGFNDHFITTADGRALSLREYRPEVFAPEKGTS
jgi:DNA repair protein RadC